MLVVAAVLRYAEHMETVVHNVRDLEATDRSAVERLVGHSVQQNQRLVIQVTDIDVSVAPEAQPHQRQSGVPDWWNIYEGLSDDEIEKLDHAIRQRADLTRVFE